MSRIISFMHLSLDGFVAGPKGEMDWIQVNEEIFDHVEKRISRSSRALYGRITYQMMENYWPNAGKKADASKHDKVHSAWYNKAHKIVLSKTLSASGLSNTTVISDSLSEKLHELKQGSDEEILLFGSPGATHSLMQENLIDGYWLFLNPVILGQGVPLFVPQHHKTKLKLTDTRTFSCGVTALNYLVDKS